MARIEQDEGVTSIFFVLLTSEFYNIFSSKCEDGLRRIVESGCEIGLHFDEVRYPDITDINQITYKIIEEAEILSHVIRKKVQTVSMHRPSKQILEADLFIPGIINSYSKLYFKEFKYLSDSRRRWREPIEEIIVGGQYKRLHILTHAFWYNNESEDIHDTMRKYINHANLERYRIMSENITDIESILDVGEVLHE